MLCSGDRIWMTNSGGGEFFGSIILDPRRNLLFGVHLSGIVVLWTRTSVASWRATTSGALSPQSSARRCPRMGRSSLSGRTGGSCLR